MTNHNRLPLLHNLFHQPWCTVLRKSQWPIALCVYGYYALAPAPDIATHYDDKSLHAIGNLLLLLSTYAAFIEKKSRWLLILLCIPFSFLVEWSQSLTDSRVFDTRDFVANSLGIAAGMVFAAIADRTIRKWLFGLNISEKPTS